MTLSSEFVLGVHTLDHKKFSCMNYLKTKLRFPEILCYQKKIFLIGKKKDEKQKVFCNSCVCCLPCAKLAKLRIRNVSVSIQYNSFSIQSSASYGYEMWNYTWPHAMCTGVTFKVECERGETSCKQPCSERLAWTSPQKSSRWPYLLGHWAGGNLQWKLISTAAVPERWRDWEHSQHLTYLRKGMPKHSFWMTPAWDLGSSAPYEGQVTNLTWEAQVLWGRRAANTYTTRKDWNQTNSHQRKHFEGTAI